MAAFVPPKRHKGAPEISTTQTALRNAVRQNHQSLRELLEAALPDKKSFFDAWLEALADPVVCIETLEDLRRLEIDDVVQLPVPPVVRRVFREVLKQDEWVREEQAATLAATASRARAFLSQQKDRNMQPSPLGSKYFQGVKNYRLILTREEIDTGVKVVAHRIEKWSKGDRIVLVGILKGAFMLMSDLCRVLTRPSSVYFVDASSYKNEQKQGDLTIIAKVSPDNFIDPTSRTPYKIVLVDELLDNGKTMEEMKQYLLRQLKDTHADHDVLTVCLFSKQRDRTWPEADITGIANLPDLWLVGYGLDDRGTKRGWTELFAMPKVVVVETIDVAQVKKLLAIMDDTAMLTAPIDFAGCELPHGSMKFRLNGLDVHGDHVRPSPTLTNPATKIASKAEVQARLDGLSEVHGKYEHELVFAFVADGLPLVPEDEIFQGNNQVYARTRCDLRARINDAAHRCGLPLLAPPEA
eukprot:CAMPEP_0204277736 /NCGR_PEP_ID=MMETSP0468-20130131/29475_1 /ASSEMBLY_ACC=CAM_ASM_000383 /TAXON_ID=2969 /ORGANISM="Oxyrrhis marina" /LENGTH=467 /DNA_ID=CAMNT_0051254565 /DNA_START=32 /DNA_END=1435 /DNA_ORIENTATION=+